MILKVERDDVIDQKTKKPRKLKYNDIDYDFDGWVDVNKFLPADYDLMYLKTDTKTYNGWLSGKHWDGLKITDKNTVKYWKRRHEHDV